MLHTHHIQGSYAFLNLSNQLSAYGYIYYANLSTGKPYVLNYLQTILSVLGLLAVVIIMTVHVCAICYARKYLYKPVYLKVNRKHGSNSNTTTVVKRKPWSLLKHIRCSCCFRNRNSTAVGIAPSKHSPHKSTLVQLPRLLNGGPVFAEINRFPGVSVIKPLTGIDPNLEVNLTSYFHMDYPKYEILFCVADKTDPACEVIRKLQSIYPHIPSRLVLADRYVGVNPKINNLQAGFDVSQYELVLISDSGVWMRPDTLSDMVSTMNSDERNGMIHQIPFMTPYFGALNDESCEDPCETLSDQLCGCVDRKRPPFAWIVQFIFFGCWHAKLYLSAALLGINCATGMSCLLRKSVLSPIGGFEKFGRYLAEDFFIAKYFIDNGWKVRLSHQPAWQNSPAPSLSSFRSRIDRWTQLRLSMVALTYFLEPFTRFLPNAILSAFALAHFLPDLIDPGVYILCYFLVWFLLDYFLLLSIYPPCIPLCITKVEFLIAWIFSELTAIPFHLRVFFKRELQWRNNRFRVHWGGLTEKIPKMTGPRSHPTVVSRENEEYKMHSCSVETDQAEPFIA